MKKLLISLLLICIYNQSFALEEHEYEFKNNEQEELFVELTEILRCPKCQNNNVADSNAEIAQDFRDKIYELVKKDMTKTEIKTYFIDRFGDFVNYETRVSLLSVWIWLIPLFILAFGIVFIFSRSQSEESNSVLLSEQEQKELDDILNKNKKSK